MINNKNWNLGYTRESTEFESRRFAKNYRTTSRLEEDFMDTLKNRNIRFIYEFKTFPLQSFIHYTPDFYLPGIRKNNKKVLLEPHGVWTRSEKRVFPLGNKHGSCQAPNRSIEQKERDVIWKYTEFRRKYGRKFHLILFVPWNDCNWVKIQYKEAYDEVYSIGDLPNVLTKLTHHNQR